MFFQRTTTCFTWGPLTCFAFLLIVLASLCDSNVLEVSAAEAAREQIPRDWVDPKTGHRVVRLSRQAGSKSLYFHQNTYTPDGERLLIETPEGLSTVHLETREIKLIVPRGRYQIGGSSGVEVGRVTPRVFYTRRERDGMSIQVTHLDTLETRQIARLPRGSALNGVNADETKILGTMSLFEPDFNDDRRRRPSGKQFFTVDIETGKINTFHRSEDWLNHAQCSPTDPTLALFCHEGLWHEVDRVWTIRFGSDTPKLMHRRQQKYEIAGHEFFGPEGNWVWYDLQTPRASEFWIAGVNVETGDRVRYPIRRGEWSVHYHVSKDGKLFCGDGGGPKSVANQTPLPEKRRLDPPGNGQWIYLFKPSGPYQPATISGEPAETGTLTSERLVDLSDHDYDFEPNATFTPDGKWVVFRSNMHGERHVYAVRVEAEASRPNAVD
jgi:oligogalacturonide lyase